MIQSLLLTAPPRPNSKYSTFQRHIVVTDGKSRVAFYKQAFAFLDGASYVQLYFPFVATSPSLLSANDAGAVSQVGTGSCLFNNDGSPSAVGNLMY